MVHLVLALGAGCAPLVLNKKGALRRLVERGALRRRIEKGALRRLEGEFFSL
jgi:hypothetical protein